MSKKETNKDSKLVVIDDGSNYLKVSYIDKDGEKTLLSFESRVINKAMPSLTGDGYSKNSFQINGNKYSVSKSSIDVIPTNNKEYQYSEHNRVLIHHALRQIGITGDVEVCATLPIGTFFNLDGSENSVAIDAKCNNLIGEIDYLDGNSSINITGCYVLPESIPAFVCAKKELKLSGDRFLVIDVGGTTTDVAIITSDNQIEKSTSFNFGAFKAIKEFTSIVCNKLDLNELSDALALNGFLTGSILGQDVSDDALRIKNDFSKSVEALIKQFAEIKLFDSVIITGGGSHLLSLAYPNVVKTSNPQFDNASGMLSMVLE